MGCSSLLKTLILAVSFIMFIYQMEQAVMRLIKPPVVELTEHLKIENHELPLITVCPKDQFDLSVLKKYGYNTYEAFLHGQYSSKVGNKSFWEIVDEALVYSVENDVDIQLTSNGTWIRSFYPKHGYCWEMMDYSFSRKLEISSKILSNKTGTMIVYLSDKDLKTKFDIHLPSSKGEHISIEQEKTITYFIEIVKVSYFDPSNSSSCKDYSYMEYAKCVDDNIENIASQIKYECNPPWLTSTNVCQDMNWLKNGGQLQYIDISSLAKTVFRPIIEMENLKEKRACPTPCTILQSKVRQGATRDSTDAEIHLLFEDFVLYSHNVINYRFADFLVDIGSSIGLWFGLSVFGLAELGIKAYNFFRSLTMFAK